MDVTGEGRDKNAAIGVLDGIVQRVTDFGLGLGEARDGGISGVRQKKVDAGLAKPGDRGIVRGDAVDRSLIELEVSCMHNGTLRRLDKDAERSGDRVRHGKEVNGKAAQIYMATTLYLTELGCANAEFGKLALDKA